MGKVLLALLFAFAGLSAAEIVDKAAVSGGSGRRRRSDTLRRRRRRDRGTTGGTYAKTVEVPSADRVAQLEKQLQDLKVKFKDMDKPDALPCIGKKEHDKCSFHGFDHSLGNRTWEHRLGNGSLFDTGTPTEHPGVCVKRHRMRDWLQCFFITASDFERDFVWRYGQEFAADYLYCAQTCTSLMPGAEYVGSTVYLPKTVHGENYFVNVSKDKWKCSPHTNEPGCDPKWERDECKPCMVFRSKDVLDPIDYPDKQACEVVQVYDTGAVFCGIPSGEVVQAYDEGDGWLRYKVPPLQPTPAPGDPEDEPLELQFGGGNVCSWWSPHKGKLMTHGECIRLPADPDDCYDGDWRDSGNAYCVLSKHVRPCGDKDNIDDPERCQEAEEDDNEDDDDDEDDNDDEDSRRRRSKKS